MKKKKYITREKMLHHLLDLVMEINSLECRKQDITGNKPTAFIEYSGHVSVVYIRVYMNGWSDGKEVLSDKNYDIYFDKDGFSLSKYKQICKELEEIRDGICTR